MCEAAALSVHSFRPKTLSLRLYGRCFLTGLGRCSPMDVELFWDGRTMHTLASSLAVGGIRCDYGPDRSKTFSAAEVHYCGPLFRPAHPRPERSPGL